MRIGVMALLFMFVVLASKQSWSSNNITLWTSLPTSEFQVLNKLLEAYEKEKGSLHVVVAHNFSSQEELKKVLLQSISSKDTILPDVALIDSKWIRDFEQYMVPAEDIMEQIGSMTKVVAKMDTFPGVYERCQIEKKLMAVPFSAKVYTLLYNEKLLKQTGIKKLPATWDELLGSAKKVLVNKPEFWGLVLPLEKGPAFLGELWAVSFHSQGGVLSESIKGGALSEIIKSESLSKLAVSTLKYWWNLMNNERVAPLYEKPDLTSVAKKAAMAIGDADTMEKLYLTDSNWRAALLPKGKSRGVMTQVFSLAVFKHATSFLTKNPEVAKNENSLDLYQSYRNAWNLVHYLTEFPQAKEWALSTSHLPSNKQVYLSPYYIQMIKKEKPWLSVYINSLVLSKNYDSGIREETYKIFGDEILKGEKTYKTSTKEDAVKGNNIKKDNMKKDGAKQNKNGYLEKRKNELRSEAQKIPGRVGIAVKAVNGNFNFFFNPRRYWKQQA